MKCTKVEEYIKRTACPRSTSILHGELEQFLRNGPGPQGRILCDRIIRACNHQLGVGHPESHHVDLLAKLVELALNGYDASVDLVSHSSPLYMEKILFHIVKKLGSLGLHRPFSHLGGLLYNRLATASQAIDYSVLVRSCFAVLWSGLSPPPDGGAPPPKEKLQRQLQALSFLLLSDRDAASPVSKAPAYAEDALAEFERGCGTLAETEASFLLRETCAHVHSVCAAAEEEEAGGGDGGSPGPPCLPAVSEVVLVAVKHLSKAGHWTAACDLMDRTARRLGGPLAPVLVLGRRAVEVHRAGRAGEGCGEALRACARALRSLPGDQEERVVHAVLEGCGLVAWAVEAGQSGAMSGATLLAWFSFLEEQQEVIQKALQRGSNSESEGSRLQQALCLSMYQGFVAAYESLLASQLESSETLDRVLLYCQATAGRMLTELRSLPTDNILLKAVPAVSNLVCGLYNRRLYDQAFTLAEILCQELRTNPPASLTVDRVSRAFMLAVQSSRRGGQLDRALDWVVLWLRALGDGAAAHLAEPVSLWAKVKADAARAGLEDARLRTLRDGLGAEAPGEAVLLLLLEEELRAYREAGGDTYQERFNTLCDLLDLCPEGGGDPHRRALYLWEMAQVVCFQDFSEQTDCSAVDFTHEALRLLESEPETAENAHRLRDDRAHVLLWQYICTLERSLQEATDRERRLQELREQSAEAAQQPVGTNDLDYEDKQRQQSGHAVYEGLDFNLAVESQRFLPLDRALGEWAALLRAGELPAVRNGRQTVSSLALVAALYRLMGKPLQALEAYKLATGLSRCLGDAQSGAASLCHSAQLLLELGAPDLAQAQLDLAEELLASESQHEGPTALSVLAVLLRAQHCYSIGQAERGVPFLCRALQETAEPRPSKSWYLLQARVLQTGAAYLGLDTGSLPEELRRRVTLHGLKSADTALYKSLKLLCSLLVTLVGGGLYGGHGGSSSSAQTRFIDQGDNLVLKWQVLSEVLGCSVKVVGARSGSGAVHEAKLQCLEALRLATKLQALSRCAELLVVKAELELMKGETEECGFDLEKVRNLLELCTDFSNLEQKAEVKIKLRKGRPAPKAEPSDPRPPEEEPRDFLNTRWFPKEAIERDQASSPPLKARPRLWLSSLGHGQGCQCPCCSEPGLGRVTARWAAAQAQLASQLGPAEAGSSRKLHLAALGRCKSVAAAFAAKLAKLSLAKGFSKPGLLQDVTGRAYLRMALSGLDARTDKAQGTWKVLEAGLAFLASKPSPELQPLKAGLLTAKALASWLALAALRDCPPEELFSAVWTWNPPKGSAAPGPSPRTPAARNPEPAGAATAKKKDAKKPKEPLPKIKMPGSAVKAKRLAPKTPVASRWPRDTPLGGGAFDFDTQVPTVACTPVHRASGPPSAARSAARGVPPKLQFQVYLETSPAQDQARPVPAAPNRTKKPRFKVEFSDESDSESNPPAGPPEKTNAPKKRTAPTTRTARAPKTPAEKGPAPRPTRAKRSTVLPRSSTSSEEEAAAAAAPGGRGRARRQPAAAEAGSWEEPEQMRTIDEETAWALDTSVEQPRASDAETDDHRTASNNDCEVLRRDLGGEVDRHRLSETRPGPGGGPPGAALPAHLSHPGPDGLSEEALRSLLRSAWLTLQHCPLPALYPRLCGLLALTLGQSEPVTTAMLHAQSLGVTSRHQMIRHLDNRLKKLKKGSGELAERLGALSLEGGEEAGGALERRLARLEGVFSFPTADPQAFPRHHCQHFTQQVQQLPSGLTVCVLSVLGVQHGGVGDTVLLTRLERDSAPVTVHVPTARRKHPVSWLVQEMDSVIKQQKVVSCVSEKARWWEGRRALDARVERLLEEMEWMLGCWRGLLLPAAAHPGLSEHAARLRKTMGTWGLEISEEMLKALLSASLSHEDLRRFAAGACPGRSQECVELLQAAASQLADGAEPAGHLVLVLDKHLQKLPWESISCLRRRSVTRMPSVHAVLSHCLLKESDPEGVLNRGVSAKRVFYVLDPDANLGDTRDRFKDWFSSKEDWHGVCGVAPDSTRLQEAVASKDLYIYVGHGAGARFLDGQKVLKQEMRAASLLFGCSSAALAVRGELEGAGIILHYLMAGCPLVLGNLWDVTDRDIDRFTKALLESWLSADPGAALLDHMASSRQATHLKHLIGAAPVVYGLPIHLQ